MEKIGRILDCRPLNLDKYGQNWFENQNNHALEMNKDKETKS